MYFNMFWGIDEFSSASRDPTVGGPLGRHGINFAAVGLGRYLAAIPNRVDKSYGFALGYQWLFDDRRKQVIVELGSRHFTEETGFGVTGNDVASLAARYQQAMGQHTILRFDVFGALIESGPEGYGARVELLYTF